MTNKLNRKVLDKRDTRETHTSQVWREELAEMLEVNLRQREALKLDSIPSNVQRMAATGLWRDAAIRFHNDP
jgi:hypothetical protein